MKHALIELDEERVSQKIVSYENETKVITLKPGEQKNFHGLCILDLISGSVELFNPIGGYVNIMHGQIIQSIVQVKAGDTGCSFSLRRPILEPII